jgi:ComF family protein
LPIAKAGLCQRCQADTPPYRAMRSWAAFDSPVRQALHKLKYRRDMGLGDALAVPISNFVKDLDWPFSVIVPVPLGQKRMQERGYNQVALISHPLSLALGRHYRPSALRRARETKSQVGLNAHERRINVEHAFTADPRHVRGQSILVVDDVATTGSTLSSCSHALLEAGATEVYALTVARALPHHGFNLV